MMADQLPTRMGRALLFILNWLVLIVMALGAPVAICLLDIAALRFVMLAPGMEITVASAAKFAACAWLLGAQGLAAIVGFALGLTALISGTVAMTTLPPIGKGSRP
jgi:hypothetical protein